MKKLLLTLLMAAGIASATQARELRFYLGDQQITDGAVIKYDKYEIKTVTPVKAEVTMKPDLYIWSDMMTNTVQVTAKSVNGQSIQMCCGGQCMSGATVVKNSVKINTGDSGRTALDFEYMGSQHPDDPVPNITVEFEAVDTKASSTKISFKLLMGPQAGLETVEASRAVSVSGNAIRYSLPGTAQVSVYDILGGKAAEATLSGEGTYSLSALPKGIYIYMVKGDAVRQSGKLVIR